MNQRDTRGRCFALIVSAFLGGLLGVGVLASLYVFALDPIPEHALLARHGLRLERWYPAVTSTICTDGRIYPPSNSRDPCKSFSPWIQP